MIELNIVIGYSFTLIKKAFSYEGGSLVLLAAGPAYTIREIINIIFGEAEAQLIFIPLFLFGVLTFMYSGVSTVDLYTGLMASKKEAIDRNGTSRGYIKNQKLWSTVWKYQGVLIIGGTITIFSILFEIVGMEWLYEIFRLGIIAFYFVVIAFDIHSIGDNQMRRYGTKPKFYGFVDDVNTAVRVMIIDRIKNYRGVAPVRRSNNTSTQSVDSKEGDVL